MQKLRTVKASYDQVLREMDTLNRHMKEEQNKVFTLQNELKSGSTVQKNLVEV